MNTNNICYTGIGSKKNGNHTEEDYLHLRTFKMPIILI